MDDPVLHEIAKSRNKTVAQICLRFQTQRGVIVIPKSLNEERIKSNLQTNNFDLTVEEMNKIRGLNRNWRGLGMDW